MALLIDEIAHFAPQARALADPVLDIYPALCDKLKGAPRFIFDENAIHTSVELTLGRPKLLLDAMRHVRVPYPSMWVEWPESGRHRIREVFPHLSDVPPERPLPLRVGYLIETDETGRRGLVTWCWNGPDREELRVLGCSPPNVAPIGAYFDLDQRKDQPAGIMEGFLRNNLVRLWNDNPIQREALFDIWRTSDHRFTDWGRKYLVAQERRVGPRALRDQLPYMWSDVYGEYIEVWSTILMLTASRRIVDYRPVDRAKLNKARAKNKKVPLMDHTAVTMHIGETHAQGQRRQPLGYARKSPRIHMVSSYLARRGDKHWVCLPYWRGSGDVIHREVRVRS